MEQESRESIPSKENIPKNVSVLGTGLIALAAFIYLFLFKGYEGVETVTYFQNLVIPMIYIKVFMILSFSAGILINLASMDIAKSIKKWLGITLIGMGCGLIFLLKVTYPYNLLGWGLIIVGLLVVVLSYNKFIKV